MEPQICEMLFAEIQQWYRTLAETQGVVPRTLTGISGKGLQFIAILDNVKLGHVERMYLVKTALEMEQSLVYAYGTLTATGGSQDAPSGMEIEITAASRERWVGGYATVTRDANGKAIRLGEWRVFRGDKPADNLMTAFLVGDGVPSNERQRFQDMWKALRKGVQYRNRANP